MRPRRVPDSSACLGLPGGNEDNYLWVSTGSTDDTPWMESVWELDKEDLKILKDGGTIELRVYGSGHPPVSMSVGPSVETRKAE